MDYFVNILFDSSGWLPFVHINWNHPSNDIFDLGSRERVSYSIWFIVIPADLTVERIHKKTSSYMLKVSAMIINIITLVICIIFTLYNNIASYKNKMRWKYTFFYRQGMDKMKIKSHLKREILLTTEIACISSIPFAGIMVQTETRSEQSMRKPLRK